MGESNSMKKYTAPLGQECPFHPIDCETCKHKTTCQMKDDMQQHKNIIRSVVSMPRRKAEERWLYRRKARLDQHQHPLNIYTLPEINQKEESTCKKKKLKKKRKTGKRRKKTKTTGDEH
jgi:hypothetical protein